MTALIPGLPVQVKGSMNDNHHSSAGLRVRSWIGGSQSETQPGAGGWCSGFSRTRRPADEHPGTGGHGHVRPSGAQRDDRGSSGKPQSGGQNSAE